MDRKYVSQEFAFVRDKLKDVARLLIQKDDKDLMEASFMIGCLHSICCQHAGNFSKEDANVDT